MADWWLTKDGDAACLARQRDRPNTARLQAIRDTLRAALAAEVSK